MNSPPPILPAIVPALPALFADRIAFVDLETTGMSPANSAITEVAVLLLTRENGQTRLEEWSSLVNPQRPIPPEIQFLTGISNDMVRNAPSFAELAPELLKRLEDSVFVAHHVRFDYGFVKQAFADIGVSFTEKTLCTVRLSKLLDPDRSPHSLDALIHRHNLGEENRHRALGDARLIYRYVRKMYERRGAEVVEPAIRRLLKQPSLPAHLPADALSRIPNRPGIYQFLGVNDQPLYIGKSIHLRERVASHFVNDHRSERGVRLASEIRRIDWQETVGDFGAQLLEQTLIRRLSPSHNSALRRKQNQVVLAIADAAPKPRPGASAKPAALLQWRVVDQLSQTELRDCYGPFNSRASAKHWLIAKAPEHGICLAALGLQRIAAGAPCFNRQLGRCAGCCIGLQSQAAMLAQLRELLTPLQMPAWPFPGGLVCAEFAATEHQKPAARANAAPANAAPADPPKADANAVQSENAKVVEFHLFDEWCYLGSVDDEGATAALFAAQPRQFDADLYRLLRRALASAKLLPALAAGPATRREADDQATDDQATGDQAAPGDARPPWRLRFSSMTGGFHSPAARGIV